MKKIVVDAEDRRKKKYEHNQRREDEERSKGLQTCECLILSVLRFDMDDINNLKAK